MSGKKKSLKTSKKNKVKKSRFRNKYPANSKILFYLSLAVFLINIIQAFTMVTITGMQTQGTASLCLIGSPTFNFNVNQTAFVGEGFYYAINSSGSDCGEVLTYNYSVNPNLASFNLDSATGEINFTPTAGENGTYELTLFFSKDGFPTANQTIYLTIFSELGGPTNVGCVVGGNHDIFINWTPVSLASYYNIYYSENISSIYNLNLSNIASDVSVINNITQTNYTDSNTQSIQKRYYYVTAVRNSSEALTSELPLGKHTYYFDAPVSSKFATLATNRLSIYLNVSFDAESFMEPIPNAYLPTLSKLEKTDAAGEFLTTHVKSLNDGHNFELEQAVGYQLSINEYFNRTICGNVYAPPYVLYFDAPISGTFGTLATNFYGIYDSNESYTAESLMQKIPAIYNSTISYLNKSNNDGEYLITHTRGINDGNNFSIELGIGYAISVDADYNLTQCNNCFS